jgi:threonine/homoserine/homoserine lactone efflux protein
LPLDLILIGLVIALEPIPITGYLLVLSSEGGLRKGLGFVLGWIATIVGLVVLTLLLTGGKPPRTSSAPGQAALIVKLVIGAALLWWAWRLQKRRPRPPSKPPSWASRIDRLSFGGAMVLGFLLQPWPLVAAGVATVTQAKLSQAATWVWLVLFCLLSASTYVVIQILVMRSPESAEARLAAGSKWITDHRDVIIVYASALLGIWLVVHSAVLLA